MQSVKAQIKPAGMLQPVPSVVPVCALSMAYSVLSVSSVQQPQILSEDGSSQ